MNYLIRICFNIIRNILNAYFITFIYKLIFAERIKSFKNNKLYSMKNLSLFIFLLLSFTMLEAQIRTPAPSPSMKVEQMVGLTTINLEYSRPGVKGRKIFAADGLVPFAKVWRTGANSATKITFSDDVKVNGKTLAAGSYAVLTIPTLKNWTVNFYNYEKSSWSSYVDATPALSATAPVFDMGESKVESFLFLIGEINGNKAKIEFLWDNVYAALDLEVDYDAKVMAAIEKTLAGPTAGDYYAAGNYMRSSGKDLNKALEYVQKATHVENPRFWQVRAESLILADLGQYKKAIEVANKSLALAKTAGNDDYVKMNMDSIAKWSKMK